MRSVWSRWCVLAVFGLVSLLAAPPAGAATLTEVVPCSNGNALRSVTLAPGDTLSVVGPTCTVSGNVNDPALLPYVSAVPNPLSFTFDASTPPGFYPQAIVYINLAALPLTYSYLDVTVAGSGGSGGSAGGGGGRTVIQEVPLPAGGCGAVADADLEWGTGLSGGWVPVWGEWADAVVCGRSLVLWNGVWRLG